MSLKPQFVSFHLGCSISEFDFQSFGISWIDSRSQLLRLHVK